MDKNSSDEKTKPDVRVFRRPALNAEPRPHFTRLEPSQPIPEKPKRVVLKDPSEMVRVSKLLSERGICSRREAEEYILKGWVMVEGSTLDKLGVRVPRSSKIELSREALKAVQEKTTILLNKPIGYVSSQPEDGYEPAIKLITAENYWGEQRTRLKSSQFDGLATAGRLDIDSTGLLIFTQDGALAKKLIGNDSEVEKEYIVRVTGAIREKGLELLNHGLELDGEPLKPARVEWLNKDQLRFILREGKKRQVRRMCESVGLKVTQLKRVRIGHIPLGALPIGKWRYLNQNEVF